MIILKLDENGGYRSTEAANKDYGKYVRMS